MRDFLLLSIWGTTVPNDNYRKQLIEIYHAALAAVMGSTAVQRELEVDPIEGPVHVVAIGKAAVDMYRGAQQGLGSQLCRALVITKQGYAQTLTSDEQMRVIESGHPWPTRASLDAGQALLQFIGQTPSDGQLLFLISGGASSLVEVLADGLQLDDLYQLNDWLLKSGLDIHAINYVRKSVSCIKGGRLAIYLEDRPCRVMLISDVPGDDPATIGSGLLVPEPLLETEAPLELPEWVEVMMGKGQSAPQAGDECFGNVSLSLIACLDDARHAAAQRARALGYDVYQHGAVISGDVALVAGQLAAELLNGDPGVYIWGGETTVRLPENPGRGGRNQHLALVAACELAEHDNVWLLAAGTDGSDGPTEDAGAVVDGGTLQRGQDEGYDPERSLAGADAGRFLEASGDLLQTGPTGTNVMDLVIGLKR